MKFRPVHLLLFCSVLFVLLAYGSHSKGTWGSATLPLQYQYTVLPDAFQSADVSAVSYLVFDVATGEEFSSRNKDDVRAMASVVKLLTAETAITLADIEASTTVSWRAVSTEGRSGKLKYGEEYRIRELLFPLLLESSNDAAEAIAEGYGRGTFIDGMNARRALIGMEHTTIVDPTGLSSRNTSTVSDLKLLLTHLYREHRYLLDITSLRQFIGREHTYYNNDPVFSSSGFIGGKHGYTDEAGKTLAAVFMVPFSGADTALPVGIILMKSTDLQKDTDTIRTELMRAVSYGPGGV